MVSLADQPSRVDGGCYYDVGVNMFAFKIERCKLTYLQAWKPF